MPHSYKLVFLTTQTRTSFSEKHWLRQMLVSIDAVGII